MEQSARAVAMKTPASCSSRRMLLPASARPPSCDRRRLVLAAQSRSIYDWWQVSNSVYSSLVSTTWRYLLPRGANGCRGVRVVVLGLDRVFLFASAQKVKIDVASSEALARPAPCTTITIRNSRHENLVRAASTRAMLTTNLRRG